MAFNLYLAGSYSSHGVDETLMKLEANRLFSQLNDRSGMKKWVNFVREGNPRQLFIDSGAHSAHTKGREVDLEGYINYVNDHQGLFTVIAQLDKIPGEYRKKKTRQQIAEAPELSWENYVYMRTRVIDVDNLVPIFHQGEDFKHLERMLEATFDGKHIPYIGISPSGEINKWYKAKWLDKVFTIISKSSNPTVKTHAFGMTSLDLLEKYPFWSADSTSWLLTSAMGSIMTTKGVILVSSKQKDNPGHYTHLPKQAIIQLEKEVNTRGYTLEELSETYVTRNINNAKYMINWSNNYVYKGGKRQRTLF